MKFKSYETEDFLAGAVKVPVEVAVEVSSSRLLFASFAFSSFSSKFVLDYASMERISIGLLLIASGVSYSHLSSIHSVETLYMLYRQSVSIPVDMNYSGETT